MTVSSRASAFISTACMSVAPAPRPSISSMSTASRCCGGRRARCTARTPPPARSTSRRARRASHPRRASKPAPAMTAICRSRPRDRRRSSPTRSRCDFRSRAPAAAFDYAPPSTDPFDRVTDLDADLNARQQMAGVSLVGNWDIGPATITSVSAWRNWDWKPAYDRDFIGLPITTVSANPSHQTQVSQEFRLASNGKSRLQYTLGAFYFRQTIHTDGLQVQGPAASRWLLNPGNVPVGPSGCATPTTAACIPATLDGLTSRNSIDFDNTSLALFGKLNWEVVDRFHIQPGVRLNYDRKSGSYVAVVTNGAGSTTLTTDQRGVLAPQSYAPRISARTVSGDLT